MGEFFSNFIVSWLPMIILVGIWIFFMQRMKPGQNQTVELLNKQNELMEQYIKVTERVAEALEKIERKQPG